MSVLTHDTAVACAYPHKREKIRPFMGFSKRHLRRKAEALARKEAKLTTKDHLTASKAAQP